MFFVEITRSFDKPMIRVCQNRKSYQKDSIWMIPLIDGKCVCPTYEKLVKMFHANQLIKVTEDNQYLIEQERQW